MDPKITIHKIDSSDQNTTLKIANWYWNEWDTPIEKTVSRLTNQPDKDTLFQLILSIDNNLVATGGLCNTVSIYIITFIRNLRPISHGLRCYIHKKITETEDLVKSC